MNPFIEYIKHRIEHNKNFLSVITGQTGSGKSYAALRLGEALDPEFNISRVAFNSAEFMEIIENGNLKSGSVIVFDEAGVGLSAQEWQSVQNKLINYVLQTFRHKNYIVIFTTPHLNFIAAQSRKLFHCYMETVRIDFTRGKSYLKPLLLQINQRKGDVYYKYLRVRTEDRFNAFRRLVLNKPSKAIVDAYEEKKTAYTDRLNKEIHAELMDRANKKPKVTARQQEVIDYLKEGLGVDAIAEALDISPRMVYDHMERIKNKGYMINPVKDGTKILSYEVET